MDSVRLGRVLGLGARMAAKTLVSAVDAATAPNPAGAMPAAPEVTGTRPDAGRTVPGAPAVGPVAAGNWDQRAGEAAVRHAPVGQVMGRARQVAAPVRATGQGLRRGTKRFGEAVWGPVVKLSGVLWLEVTGVFFGLFALSAGVGAWKLRGAALGAARVGAGAPAADPAGRGHLAIAAGLALVFGYFCVSSFARAHLRGRGR